MANTINFLSLTGLQTYDQKIKAFITEKVDAGDAPSFKYVDLVDGWLKFYNINPILEDTDPVYQVELPEQDLSHLMQLVESAVNGNIAIFGDNGQVKDGGIALTDLSTKTEVTATIAPIQAKADENAQSIEDLKSYVGTIPTNYTETNIVDYINKKSQETLEAASGGSNESASSVKIQLDTYIAENDSKVNANTENIASLQTAVNEANTAIDNVVSDLETETSERKSADEAQIARIASLEEQIVNISGAMHFCGILGAIPTDVSGYEAGDVIIVGNKEYVFNGSAFIELGDVTAETEAITSLAGRVDTVESDLDNLEQIHADDKAELSASIAENAQAVANLEASLVEITEEQINGMFSESAE